jgi:hypothetical protein
MVVEEAAKSRYRICSVPCDYCGDRIKKYEVYCVYIDKYTSDNYWIHIQCEDAFKQTGDVIFTGSYKNSISY